MPSPALPLLLYLPPSVLGPDYHKATAYFRLKLPFTHLSCFYLQELSAFGETTFFQCVYCICSSPKGCNYRAPTDLSAFQDIVRLCLVHFFYLSVLFHMKGV